MFGFHVLLPLIVVSDSWSLFRKKVVTTISVSNYNIKFANKFPLQSSSSAELAPVLFYIHGGGFEIGNAKIYGYE